MADQDARALLLTIQANTELLRSNLSAAERAVEEFTKKTEEHLSEQDEKFELFGKGLEKLEGPLERLKGLTEVAVGALLGESLVEAGKKGLEFAGNVKFVSEQVGTSTDFLQKYRFAAGQFGVASAEADEGLNKFARSIGETANGNKTLIDLFNRLGVNIRDANGNVRSVEAVFLDTANAIKALDNPAQKSADTLTLMGKNASGLVPLLAQGATGFNDLGKAAEQLGVVLGPDLIEHSEEVNHKLAALKTIVDAQMASAIAQNAAAIEQFASSLVTVAGAFAKFLQSNPKAALGLLGSAAGFLKGGPEGALIGAGLGVIGGEYLGQKQDDDTTDIAKREAALRAAAKRVRGDQLANNGMKWWQADAVVHEGSSTDDLPAAQKEFKRQRDLYQESLRGARERAGESEFGSAGAGTTNNNGDDLRKAQTELITLQKAAAGKSGDVLKAYNEQIASKQREIAFIKQGADAEMASTLAAKQGAIQRTGETDARTAARKAAEEAQRRLKDQRVYRGQIGQADTAVAEANLKLSDTPDARYNLEIERLRNDLTSKNDQLDAQVAQNRLDPNKGITSGQAFALRVRYGAAEQSNEQFAGKQRDDQTAQQQLNIDTDALGRQRDLAQVQEDLAGTTKDRLAIALKLLDLDEQAQRLQLTYQRDHAANQADRDRAQASLDALPEQTAAKRADIQNQNLSPLAAQRKQLSDAVGDIGTDVQNIEVSAIDDLGNSLETTASKALHLHGILGSIADDILKIFVQREIELPIANALTGTKSSGGGGFFGKLLSGAGKLFGGGGGGASADASIDPDLFLAGGGHVNGPGSGTSDSIPARLSDGEFVVNAKATRANLSLLHAINDNRVPRFAAGGLVSSRAIVAPSIPDAARIGEARAAAAGGAVNHFHLEGAVVTQDLVDQMNAIGAQAADQGASRGFQMSREHAARQQRYSYSQS